MVEELSAAHVVVLLALVSVHAVSARLKHLEEWQLWKTDHKKSYESQGEELERHLVWLSNREYIIAHNKNAHIMGYSLHLNQFADWVSCVCRRLGHLIRIIAQLVDTISNASPF